MSVPKEHSTAPIANTSQQSQGCPQKQPEGLGQPSAGTWDTDTHQTPYWQLLTMLVDFSTIKTNNNESFREGEKQRKKSWKQSQARAWHIVTLLWAPMATRTVNTTGVSSTQHEWWNEEVFLFLHVNCLYHFHSRIPLYLYPYELDKKLKFCIKM